MKKIMAVVAVLVAMVVLAVMAKTETPEQPAATNVAAAPVPMEVETVSERTPAEETPRFVYDNLSPSYEIGGWPLDAKTAKVIELAHIRGNIPSFLRIVSVAPHSKGFLITTEHVDKFFGVRAIVLDINSKNFKTMVAKTVGRKDIDFKVEYDGGVGFMYEPQKK